MITAGIPTYNVVIEKNLYTQKESIQDLTQSRTVTLTMKADELNTNNFVMPEIKLNTNNKGRASK